MAEVGEEIYEYQVVDIFVKDKVYLVSIGDLKDKKTAVLKDLSNNNQEIKNTIGFFLSDENRYFVDIEKFNKNYLLLKYYKNGTLYDYLSKNSNLDLNKRYDFISEILNIGCYLHDNSYLHADIKPNNFFVDDDLTIKLGDLESVTYLKDIYSDKIEKTCGTQGFKYSLGRIYDLKDEMFAYIATIYYILTNELLITKDDLDTKINIDENDLIEEFNNFAKEKIDQNSKLTNEEKEFLKSNLDNIKNESKFDCCNLATKWDEFNNIEPPISPHYPPKNKKPFIKFLLSNIKVITLSLFIIVSIVIATTLFKGSDSSSNFIPEVNNTYEDNSSENNNTHENEDRNTSLPEENNITEPNYTSIVIPKPKPKPKPKKPKQKSLTEFQQGVIETLKAIEIKNYDYNFSLRKKEENNVTFRIHSKKKGFLYFIVIGPDDKNDNISIKETEIEPQTEYNLILTLNSNKKGKYLIYLVYTLNRVNFKQKSHFTIKLYKLSKEKKLEYLKSFKVDL